MKTVVQKDLSWSKYFDELKRQCRSALNVWRENGCPMNGFVCDEYKQSKREYKKVVKDDKCNDKRACASRLSDAWNCRDNKRFWRFWKSVGNKTEATNLLNPNSFFDIFQNNFIDSKNNAQAFKSFNDKPVASNDNIIQFGADEIEKL